ncbi:MAG: class I SAM-dependent methyltransferase [Myxococcota bacterium]
MTGAERSGEDRALHETRGEISTRGVREHYRRLAGSYDRGANAACQRTYLELLQRTLGGSRRVLEVGAGTAHLVSALPAPVKLACDLSIAMLRAGERGDVACQVADAQRLPYADGSFDGAFAINLLEHLPDPARMLKELARVLSPAGCFVAVTPNGDRERLLDLAERLHLKLPEGPHRFLTMRALSELAGEHFRVLEHRAFLAFPAGPGWWVRMLDRLLRAETGRGLFQYLIAVRPD